MTKLFVFFSITMNPILNYILERQQNKSLLISMDYNKQENMWFGVIPSGDTIGHTQRCKWERKEREKRHNPRLSTALGGAVGNDNHELSPGFLHFINGDF